MDGVQQLPLAVAEPRVLNGPLVILPAGGTVAFHLSIKGLETSHVANDPCRYRRARNWAADHHIVSHGLSPETRRMTQLEFAGQGHVLSGAQPSLGALRPSRLAKGFP